MKVLFVSPSLTLVLLSSSSSKVSSYNSNGSVMLSSNSSIVIGIGPSISNGKVTIRLDMLMAGAV